MKMKMAYVWRCSLNGISRGLWSQAWEKKCSSNAAVRECSCGHTACHSFNADCENLSLELFNEGSKLSKLSNRNLKQGEFQNRNLLLMYENEQLQSKTSKHRKLSVSYLEVEIKHLRSMWESPTLVGDSEPGWEALQLPHHYSLGFSHT